MENIYHTQFLLSRTEYFDPIVSSFCELTSSTVTLLSLFHSDKKNKCHFDKCKFSTCTPSKLKNHVRTVHTHRVRRLFVVSCLLWALRNCCRLFAVENTLGCFVHIIINFDCKSKIFVFCIEF